MRWADVTAEALTEWPFWVLLSRWSTDWQRTQGCRLHLELHQINRSSFQSGLQYQPFYPLRLSPTARAVVFLRAVVRELLQLLLLAPLS